MKIFLLDFTNVDELFHNSSHLLWLLSRWWGFGSSKLDYDYVM